METTENKENRNLFPAWNRIVYVVILYAIIILFFSTGADAQTWHSGSSNRRAITFSSADFDEDITDFIYYFSVSGSAFEWDDNCSSVKNTNGYDMVFTDVAGVILDHEIIEYDDENGIYRGWVEVASISSSTNTTIYLFYGERDVVTNPSTTNVYAADMVGAWHFDAASPGSDARSIPNDLALTGTVEGSGILDECVTFDGNDDSGSINSDDFGFEDGSFSIEGWINIQPKVGGPAEFVQTIIESSEHAEEMLNTPAEFDIDGHVLQLGRNVSQYNDFAMIGIQFPTVPVPQGNVVTDAYIEFVAQNDGSGFAQFNIGVEDSDSPLSFSTVNRPSARSLTAAGQIEWVPTVWTEGETYRTPNIASLIQPLVDDAGWHSGTLAVLIDGFGSREADNDGINLVIEYENPGGSTLYQLAVEASGDDAEEDADDGSILLTGPLTLRASTNEWVGVRFANVAIPNNAVIDEVRVRFTADANGNGADPMISISREDSYNTLTFTATEINELNKRPKTITSVSWEPTTWTEDNTYSTPDLISLFTDFFSEPEWSSGNAVTLYFQPISGGGRTAKSVGASGIADDPQLLIYYYIPESEPQTILSRHDANGGFNVSVNQYGKLAFAVDNDGTWDKDVEVTSLDNVDDSQWYHFAAVKEEARLSLYLNGEPQDSRSQTHQTTLNLIQTDNDDAAEDAAGVVTRTDPDGLLYFGDDNTVGLRFQGVNVPAGATIVSSFIQIISDNSGSDQCDVNIYGHVGDAAPFSGTANELSNLVTGTTIPWSIDAFAVASGAHNSPDISTIVQNNISSGWASGDDMVFLFQGVGTGEREARAREGVQGIGGTAALFIEYYTVEFGSISGGSTTMYIGDDVDDLGTQNENMLGSIDELRIYNSALSGDKVKAQYQTLAEVGGFSTLASTADQVTWTGDGGDGDWENGDNWNTGIEPWDSMDFVYTSDGTPLLPASTLTAGHLSADAGVSFDLNDQQLDVDCSCEIETFSGGPTDLGTVNASGMDIPFTSPGTSTTIPNLRVAVSSSLVLSTDLVVTDGLSFADANGTIDANGQNITFSEPAVYAPSVSLSNLITLGSGGTLTVENVPAAGTAVFPVSYDGSDDSFARVELTNNEGGALGGGYSVSICDVVFDDGTCDDMGGGTQLEVNDVNKTWDITTSSGDSNLSLFWNSSTEGDEFVNESAQINHYDAVTDMRWEFVGSAGSTEHITDMIYSVQALNVMDFSPFSISSHGAPLPVELLSFEATPRENSVRVQWKTESELNNDHFVLEKSIDGESFEVMEVVAGSGNSSQQIEYKIFDQNPVEGYQYYQLTQVDFDGTRENLGIRRVEFRGSGALDFYMFPNPTSNVARISNLSAGHYEAEILSIDGRIISTREVTIDSHNQIVEFRVENLPTGVYMLNLQSGSSVYSKKLVKR